MTETALSTALYVAYMGEQLGNFGLVVGIALILADIGFIILALVVLRRPEPATLAPVPSG